MSNAREIAAISFRFLRAVRLGDPVEDYLSTIAEFDDSTLRTLRDDSDAAKAFWLNLYNAFVQRWLAEDSTVYDGRRGFFGEERITVAGTDLNLDEIETAVAEL